MCGLPRLLQKDLIEHGKVIATAFLENIFEYWVPSKQ